MKFDTSNQSDTLKMWIASSLTGLLLALSANVFAEDPVHLEPESSGFVGLDFDTEYTLGLARFDLDTHTEILGWQVSDQWYFGRQDGADSGLTLVWQEAENQVSLSKDGLRLTRRF